MKLRLLLFLLLLSTTSWAQNDPRDTTSLQIRTGTVASGFYTRAPFHLPAGYASNPQTKYPLIVFLHGLGESGNTPAQLIANSQSGGPCYVIGQAQWPTSTVNPIDAQSYQFIVVSPIQQSTSGASSSGSISAAQLNFILDDLYSRYRIDTTRVYLTGLSAGGQGVVDYAGNISDPNSGGVIPIRHNIAAIVPMSAEFSGSFAKAIADTIFRRKMGLVPVGSPPDTHGANTLNIGYYINQDSAGYVVQTVFSGSTYNGITYAGGHCCWSTIYIPTFRYTWRGHSDNIYESMLRFTLNVTQVVASNAGPDQSITLPTSSITFAGSGSPSSGHTVTSNTWSQISGPNTATITTPSSYTSTVTGLIQGSYVFRLTVVDNAPTTATDDITVVVNAGSVPHANAGTNQTIVQPIDSVTLDGTGSTVTGGTISSYAWTFVSGPVSPAIVSPSASTTRVGKFSATGTYVFRLTITDNNSNTNSSTVTITVSPAPPCGGVRRQISITADDQGKFFNNTTAWNPGDTIVVMNGHRWAYISGDGIHGKQGCPITIINDTAGTGQIEMTAGISFSNSTYLHITGTGAPTKQFYGFYIHSYDSVNPVQRGNSLQISQRSRCVEIDHIDERARTYAIWVKDEAECPDSLQYPNWHIDSITLHDIRAVNINQDGFYLGSTSPNATRSVNCNGVTIFPVPLRLSNIKVYNIILDSVGRTGIQCSGCDSGVNEFYNNRITRTGYEFNPQQGSGLIFGGYSNGYAHDNYIRNTFQHGILSLGAGIVRVENNDIDSSGYLQRVGADTAVKNPGYGNITFDTRVTHTNTLDTSTPAIPLTAIVRNNKVGVSMNQNPQTLQFYSIDLGAGYNPLQPWTTNNIVCGNIKQNGVDTAVYRVNVNITYSSDCTLPPPPNVFAGNNQNVQLPVTAITLSGTAIPNGGSSITNVFWYDTTSLASTIVSPTSMTTNVTNLAAGVHIFSFTATATGGVSASSFVTVTVVDPSGPVYWFRRKGYRRRYGTN